MVNICQVNQTECHFDVALFLILKSVPKASKEISSYLRSQMVEMKKAVSTLQKTILASMRNNTDITKQFFHRPVFTFSSDMRSPNALCTDSESWEKAYFHTNHENVNLEKQEKHGQNRRRPNGAKVLIARS